jgi:SAM-dependent methyltransferase
MARDDTAHPQGGAGPEGYTVGYRPWLLQLLSQRRVETDGAFFVPYVRPDMRLLDCGCGPGVMTVEWAKLVAPGDVVGLDLEVHQCEAGRARAHADGVANVRFVGGISMPFPFPTTLLMRWLPMRSCTICGSPTRP